MYSNVTLTPIRAAPLSMGSDRANEASREEALALERPDMNLHMTDVTCSCHGCLPSPLKRSQGHAILNANVSVQCMHVEMGGHFNEQSKGGCSDTTVVIRVLDYECHVPTVRSGSVQFGQSDHFTVSLNEKDKVDIRVRQHLIQVSIGSLRYGTEEAVGEGSRGAASQHGFDRWTIAWLCPRECNVGKCNGVGRHGNRGIGANARHHGFDPVASASCARSTPDPLSVIALLRSSARPMMSGRTIGGIAGHGASHRSVSSNPQATISSAVERGCSDSLARSDTTACPAGPASGRASASRNGHAR